MAGGDVLSRGPYFVDGISRNTKQQKIYCKFLIKRTNIRPREKFRKALPIYLYLNLGLDCTHQNELECHCKIKGLVTTKTTSHFKYTKWFLHK